MNNTRNEKCHRKLNAALSKSKEMDAEQTRFIMRTIKKCIFLLKTEQLSPFLLTFRLRLIVNNTDECIR